MAFQGAPFPAREVPIGPDKLFTLPLLTWFRDVRQSIDDTPSQTAEPVQLTGQSASIGTTAFPTDPLAPGLYLFTWHARITTPDPVSNSLTVTLAWTEGGVSCTKAFTAITGTTTATTGSDSYLIEVDATTPVSYSTTYASNTPGLMVYRLDMTLQSMGGA